MRTTLAILLLVLLAACGAPSSPEYHVGTEGIVLRFAQMMQKS